MDVDKKNRLSSGLESSGLVWLIALGGEGGLAGCYVRVARFSSWTAQLINQLGRAAMVNPASAPTDSLGFLFSVLAYLLVVENL